MRIIKCIFFGLLFLCVTAFRVNAATQQLANYLGAGNNPRLSLELSPENGPSWQPFTIDYQMIGNVPWSKTPANDWSPWNVKDEAGHYYGTITLHSDGNRTAFGNYTPGKQGYYLEGINFTYNATVKAYQLTVDKIHGGITIGPFPDTPLAQPAVYSGTVMKIMLNTNGATIINNKGNKISLKGLVRPSLEWNQQGEHLSAQDIQNIKKWGANVIRIDLNQNYWFASAPVTQTGSYKQIINAMVYYAIQNNMAVILDLHWTENGHQSNMANKASIQFWKEVAAEYKEFGTVIFELFNEPVNIDKETWLNGNAIYAGYQALYDAVRATGAQNICIINGLDWGYDLSFVNDQFRVRGDNIMYGSHPYNRTHFEQNFSGVLGRYPLIFTEFGVNQEQYFPNGYQTVYQSMLDFANQHQINYTGFAWWVDNSQEKQNTFPDLIKDWAGTPLNGGILIQEDMKKYPGSGLA